MATNSILTPSIIAPAALAKLENALVMGQLVYRDLETQYEEAKIGDTVSMRRPMQYTVRDGATASAQDSVEGKVQMVVSTQKGVDIEFTSAELTLSVDEFAERHLKPAMIVLANKIDSDLYAAAYKATYNWVGTPGQTINSFADFTLGPQRLDEMAVPVDSRVSTLSPADQWGLVAGFGNGANFFQPDIAKTAIQKAKLPLMGNVDTYMSQNVSTHTVGTYGGTTLVAGANQTSAYTSVKDTYTQTLNVDGWNTSSALKAGDVFTIANVYAVNPVGKDTLPFLQQFVVTADAVAATSTTSTTALTISPPIITSGAYQTVNSTPADNAAVTVMGTSATGYRQNLVFHPNAFALACVPLYLPGGAASKARHTKNGFSIRVVETYNGSTDVNQWRFDVLYGVKAIDPRLATRLSGSP